MGATEGAAVVVVVVEVVLEVTIDEPGIMRIAGAAGTGPAEVWSMAMKTATMMAKATMRRVVKLRTSM